MKETRKNEWNVYFPHFYLVSHILTVKNTQNKSFKFNKECMQNFFLQTFHNIIHTFFSHFSKWQHTLLAVCFMILTLIRITNVQGVPEYDTEFGFTVFEVKQLTKNRFWLKSPI